MYRRPSETVGVDAAQFRSVRIERIRICVVAELGAHELLLHEGKHGVVNLSRAIDG